MGCVAGAGIKVTPMHWESYVSVQDSGDTFIVRVTVSPTAVNPQLDVPVYAKFTVPLSENVVESIVHSV